MKNFASIPKSSGFNPLVFLSSILIIFISACSVGPDYIPPEMQLPAEWKKVLNQPELLTEKELGNYWKLLNDPLLEKLIEKGLSDNLSLEEAAIRIEEASALYGVARGGFYPDIDLNADVRKRRRSEAVASAIANPNNDFISVGGALNWEIDILGRVRRLNESAQAEFQASLEDFHGVQVSLIAEITQGYIRFRTIQTQVLLTEDNIASQRESLKLAEDLFQAGVVPELDVRQAESNLGQTEAALPALRIRLARELHALAVLLGDFPEEFRTGLQAAKPIPTLKEFDRNRLPLNILRQRPDIRAAERRLASQHALIGATEAELYPIVSLPGQFSFEALDTLENAFQRGSLAYSIGPSISLNLLDFGRVRGRIAAQDARARQLLQAYKQRVLVAAQQVEDALVSQYEEKIRSKHLMASVEASKKSTELVKTLYSSGLTDFQNVLDSERRLFEQELSLSQSQGNAVEAIVSLFRSLGGGWRLVQKEARDTQSLEADSVFNLEQSRAKKST